MLTPIQTSGKQAEINTLNSLIRLYDQKKSDRREQAMLLAQIHTLSETVFIEMQTKHDPNFVDKDIDNYLNWYSNNLVMQELSTFETSVFPGTSGEKSVLELAKHPIPLPTVKEWTKQTTPRNFLAARNELYEKIDPLLLAVHQQRTGQHESEQAKISYYNALEQLKSHLLLQLNHPTETTRKPVAQHRLRTLLSAVLFEMNYIFETLEDKKTELEHQRHVAAELLGSRSPKNGALLELSKQLSSNQTDIIPGFETRRLGPQGGGNNKNWVTTNLETGQSYLIRMADGNDYKPGVINQLRRDPEICKFLTQDYLRAVTPLSAMGNNNLITVSEFCQNGDILRYQSQKAKAEPELSASMALQRTLEVAEFVALLARKGYGHPDIKAENFLVNDQLQLAVSDIKFIRPLKVDGTLEKYQEVNTTYSFAAPEYLGNLSSNVHINMDKFSSYQLAVMLYDLLTMQQGDDKLSWASKLQLAGCDATVSNTADALDFSAEIFQTAQGKAARELIQMSLQANPEVRPGVDDFMSRLKQISLVQQSQNADDLPAVMKPTTAPASLSMKENLNHLKNQAAEQGLSYGHSNKTM
ncbi:protein kinase domain-containing protein [Legionella quinlivanii]|uniref:protein kinase domain-containing protein n=1 Tax=Legionella quinlivanii TaxID=45073 RepID=UPI002244522D|nr:protein kinase [Legionella quinlivanii]MCW8451920.1 protein kinase [Legionella quinlivanii]